MVLTPHTLGKVSTSSLFVKNILSYFNDFLLMSGVGYMQRSLDNSQKSVLSFYHVGPGN